MRTFIEISEKEKKELTKAGKTIVSIEVDGKILDGKEFEPSNKPLSKSEITKATEDYLNKKGIVRQRYELGQIYADGLTKATGA